MNQQPSPSESLANPADADPVNAETLRYLWTENLDPLFWREGRAGGRSAWYAHVPFAHWIVGAAKPRTIVELGTASGVSYSAFCEAVVRNELDSRCYGIDTWIGDHKAGDQVEEVCLSFRRFHDQHYSAFSEILRCTFDDGLSYIADTSVDMLHIDGLHTYQAVRRDFESWQPKLSENAVVLFHATSVRDRDFEVWRLWQELRVQFPSFEFLHGHGLGVLAVGRSIPSPVTALCSLRDPARVNAIRQRFSFLGERWKLLDQVTQLKQMQTADVAARDARIQSLEAEAAKREQLQERERAAREARIESLEAQAAHLETELARRLGAESELRARAAQRSNRARAEAAYIVAKFAHPTSGTPRTADPEIKAVRPVKIPKPRLLYISSEPDAPGNLYRVVRYAEAAIAAGAQASWICLDKAGEHSNRIGDCDIVVIWRTPWDERVAFVVDLARRTGARVVFDIDDLLVDPDLARIDVIDGIRTSGFTELHWQDVCARFRTTMVAADYCTVPTEELAANIRRLGCAALVLPNGFDSTAYKTSRRAVRRRRGEIPDGLVRIGYAGGTYTHQRDFAVAAEAVARVLRDRPHCRLVLFRTADANVRILDIEEFQVFRGIEDQIEWRNFVPLSQLPEIMAGFDINIAPLEVGNVFCEGKSELKFFEAALVDVPTIASPTGPFRRAIQEGVTGFLADRSEEWYATLLRLVDDPALRRRVARAAQHDVLWTNGPLRRVDAMGSALPQLQGDGPAAARAFALELHRDHGSKPLSIHIPNTEVAFEADKLGDAEITVVVTVHDYAPYIEEALESVRAQTLRVFDLIVVDDASADASLSVTVGWAQRQAKRFNRLVVLRSTATAGIGPTRNSGIDAADTLFVLTLGADSPLLPECVAVCLSAIGQSGAAFACPQVQHFGAVSDMTRNYRFEPGLFIGRNFIGPVAVLAKEAWAAVGGYGDFPAPWQDFDLWCSFVEKGLGGCVAGDVPLAKYHVDGSSMLPASGREENDVAQIVSKIQKSHPWVSTYNQSHPTWG